MCAYADDTQLYLSFKPDSEDNPSSETQGQIVGARESLNGRENMVRRKVKNGEKSPWGQCLTRPVPNGRRRSGFLLVPENVCVFLPNQKAERRRLFGTGLVRHCPQGLLKPFFAFLCAIFSRPFRLSLAPTICPWVSEDEDNQTEAVDAVQGCIEDIRAWRAADQIRLNEDKSEVILTGIQQQLNKVNIAYLEIIQASVPIVRSCHKLGVIQSVLCSFNSSLP